MPFDSNETFTQAASGEIGGAFRHFFGRAQPNVDQAAFYAAMGALSQRLGSGQIRMANKSVVNGRDSAGPATTVSADLNTSARSYKAALVLEGAANQFTFSKLELAGAGSEKMTVNWPDRYPVVTYTDAQGKSFSHAFAVNDRDMSLYNSIVNPFLNALTGTTDEYWDLPSWNPL